MNCSHFPYACRRAFHLPMPVSHFPDVLQVHDVSKRALALVPLLGVCSWLCRFGLPLSVPRIDSALQCKRVVNHSPSCLLENPPQPAAVLRLANCMGLVPVSACIVRVISPRNAGLAFSTASKSSLPPSLSRSRSLRNEEVTTDLLVQREPSKARELL